MSKILDNLASVNKALVKEAFFNLAVNAGKALWNNKGKALGAALTGMGAASDVNNATSVAQKARLKATPYNQI